MGWSLGFGLPLDRIGLDLCLSLALPLIENFASTIMMVISVVVEVIHIVIGDIFGVDTETGDLLLHLVASNTVGVKGLVEVGDDKAFHMEIGSTSPILNALNSC